MNTLEKDFNHFMSRRLTHVEAQLPVYHNEAAITLSKTLNQNQLQLLIQANDYTTNYGSICEEAAYRQGLIDAFGIMASLKNFCL